jgi:hypothetical protein
MIRATDPLKLAQAQEKLRKLAVDTTPDVRNLQAANSLVAIDILEFRGRVFVVPPLPWRLGSALLKLSLECKKIPNLPDAEARLKEELRICDEASTLFNRAVVPVGWKGVLARVPGGRWVVQKVLANPFFEASIYEVQQLLLFFSTCRTTSSVRLGTSAQERVLRPS